MGRTLVVAVIMTATVAAQTPAPTQTPMLAPRISTGDLRHHIFVMEGALARAVQFGALQVIREMRSVSPELFSVSGDTSARGVYLEDYGVYFDVGVPSLRPSMVWSFRQIYERDDRNTRELIGQLRRMAAGARGPEDRRTYDAAIARLEATLAPADSPQVPGLGSTVSSQPGAGVGAAMIAPEIPTLPPGAPAPAPPAQAPPAETQTSRIVADRAILKDPDRAYTEAVHRALIDAMIDFSAPMLIAPEEWLTVAARDNAPRDIFAPQDPFNELATVLLRIKGEDLAAYRSGKIGRDEAKKRVQVREF
jgi:hypothetical protein